MQVRVVDIVCVFGAAVSGSPEIADDVACLYDAPLLERLVVGIVFPQMGIVVISLFVLPASGLIYPAALGLLDTFA